jgi:hypothetical protein
MSLILDGTSGITQLAGTGTTTNDSAAAGYVGQYIESIVSAVNFPATGAFGDLTSISLTAGDWDVSLNFFADNTGVTGTEMSYGISQTTGNSTTGLVYGSNRFQIIQTALQTSIPASISGYRQSLSGTTTIYAKFKATYTVGTPNSYARLSARRVR